MIASARISSAIELIAAIDAAPRKPADAIANDYFRQRRFIGSGDRRSVSDRVWTILRTRRRLSWWLDRVGMKANPRMLAAASLLTEGWLLSGVQQSFSGGQFGPTPLNPAERDALSKLEGHTLEHPEMPDAVELEVPDWLVPHLKARFGKWLKTEMAAMDLPATLDLRVNLLRGTVPEAVAALAAEGIEAKPTPISPWGLRIEGRRPVSTGAAFQSGLVEIQDEGSQLVAAMVGAQPEMRFVDWCAGAGGKTLALGAVMRNTGRLYAFDISEKRLAKLKPRLARSGLSNVHPVLIAHENDAKVKRLAGKIDRVLVDAPCSGLGTLRRNPDVKWRQTPQGLDELNVKQISILNGAARLVKTGGRLVYATCSLLQEENEAIAAQFLATHEGFALVPMSQVLAEQKIELEMQDYLKLYPHRHQTDGFFAAVFERK